MTEQIKEFFGQIIVAEDDPDDRLLVKQSLQDAGFAGKLKFVNDAFELMKYLRCSKRKQNAEACSHPNLILLDLNMPGKNGREVLQEIKADPDFHGIKIVAMTGGDFGDDEEICRNLGADRLMTKPANYAAWVKMMDRVLRLMQNRLPKE